MFTSACTLQLCLLFVNRGHCVLKHHAASCSFYACNCVVNHDSMIVCYCNHMAGHFITFKHTVLPMSI